MSPTNLIVFPMPYVYVYLVTHIGLFPAELRKSRGGVQFRDEMS